MTADFIQNEPDSFMQNVTWNITNFQPNQVEVQFNFSAPSNVSIGSEADVIVVKLTDITTFVG